MDFTLSKYKLLLKTLQDKGYIFTTFYDYLTQKQSFNHSINTEPLTLNLKHTVILRHDVDLKPQNSLATAKIEHQLGIKGSYYFRMVPEPLGKNQSTDQSTEPNLRTRRKAIIQFYTERSAALSLPKGRSASNQPIIQSLDQSIFNPQIIQQIAELGHEVGYHYETMDTISTSSRSRPAGGRSDHLFEGEKDYFVVSSKKEETPRNDEIIDAAYQLFCNNLETFRQISDIKTICMHGSPRSKYDNREIWKKYDYKKLGIIGEPYFDINFNEVFYLTDTGRRWDGHKVSVRDKMLQQEQWNREGLRFRATQDIIKAVKEHRLPDRIMITVHPQRWTNSFFPWAKELVWQNMKNLAKRILIENQVQP